MHDIIPFEYGSNQIRVIKDDQAAPWWVAKEVCEILEYSRQRNAMRNLEEDEAQKMSITDSLGRNQETWIINESGLYALIIRSNKPEARKFRKWITSTVLPQIRKTGTYVIPGSTEALRRRAKETKLIGSIFKTHLSVAKAMGFRGNRAISNANAAVKKLTGYDFIDAMEVSDIISSNRRSSRNISNPKKLSGHIDNIESLMAEEPIRESYWDEIISDFIDDCCEISQDAQIGATLLYEAFCKWNRFRNGSGLDISQRLFGRHMKDRFESIKIGIYIYIGIKLCEE